MLFRSVAAVDAVIPDVMLVAELHRLLARNVLPRQIGRAGHRKYGNERQSDQKESRKDTEARDKIRTAMKNLGHVFQHYAGERSGMEPRSGRPTS